MAATSSDLPALEREVLQLLTDLPTSVSNAEQLTHFQRVQELVLHRDPTGDACTLLHAAAPFLPALAQLQNAALAAALLQLLATAARRNPQFLRELFDAINTLLVLSYATEKNVLSAIELALTTLPQAFEFALAATAPDERCAALWTAVTLSLEHMVELVATTPLGGAATTNNNNRSACVWLRAWKCLERAALLLTPAADATMYRDPARSNVQPDALTVDRVALDHPVLTRTALETLGLDIVRVLSDRIGRAEGDALPALARREVCVALNSLALLAALRPLAMPVVLPALIAFQSERLPGSSDRVVQATLRANLVKLLSHPSAQRAADEVTECLIALGASERAFRAISKAKVPRRKYVQAPSEASLRKAARINKRSAQSIAAQVANDTNKRHRIGDVRTTAMRSSSSSSSSSSRSTASALLITHEALVDMASSAVVNLVLESFTTALPTPAPPQLPLELTPRELKVRMAALLTKLATPSSVQALETSAKRMRDPRRRRADPRTADRNRDREQPALVQVFDADGVDEVSDWVSKNASSIAEPLISVDEDNNVRVFVKPATAAWCREMAIAALARILDSEDGVRICGDEQLRERVLCRLASSPWLLLRPEDGDGNDPSDHAIATALPTVYHMILEYVLEDAAMRAPLAIALLYHEYARFTRAQLVGAVDNVADNAADDRIYRQAVASLFEALVTKCDFSASADKKLFASLVAQVPRVTTELLQLVATLLSSGADDNADTTGGVVLAITILRDWIRERATCQAPALRLLLRATRDVDESTRNSAIRCVANQLYSVESLRNSIEQFAIRLVESLGSSASSSSSSGTTTADRDVVMADAPPADDAATRDATKAQATDSRRTQWLRRHVRAIAQTTSGLERDLLACTGNDDDNVDDDIVPQPHALENEPETLRRLELFLALCAKKPALLTHLIQAYAHARDAVRQVVFHAIEKLIKHLKQRGGVNVVAQLHGFDASALGLVCHVIQILSVRTAPTTRPSDDSAAAAAKATTADLVQQVLRLYHAHTHVPDAISVLIPILPSIRAPILFPLLPQLLALPHARLAVALTRLLEAMPPQVVAPIDLLVALHHVDLKSEPAMQKRVIAAITMCVEHRHAFPSDVLLHVCRVLVQEERISRLALRTLIVSVTTYPTLQQGIAALLETLVSRRVWTMDDDAIWKGFVKCAALVQPASFPLLLQRLPVPQLDSILTDEPALCALLQQFATTPETTATLRLSPAVREVLARHSNATKTSLNATNEPIKDEAQADASTDVKMEELSASEQQQQQQPPIDPVKVEGRSGDKSMP